MTAAVAVLLPFLGAAAALLLPRWGNRSAQGGPDPAAGRRVYRRAAWFVIVPTAASMGLALWIAGTLWLGGGPATGGSATGPAGGPFWAEYLPGATGGTLTLIDTGSLPISLALRVDGLAALVAVLVTVVALAVQVYSVGYMRHEARYPSYAAFIALFTSAMLLVVYAADLIALYVGWEVMGLCSYLLIGHWWEDRANSRAAVKAFLVTRLGDVGFLFGIFTLGFGAGGFRIDQVIQQVPHMSPGVLITGTMLLLAGVAGKSAQVPLHTWLPDAMAGPTPISALIHAATMVAAGIFIVARLYPAFLAAGPTMDVLAVAAALGMLGAALAALAQDDLKRVLAYSTISQLAYMAGALAAGSDQAAIFHLITHGAFKALLFLCAGVVIHRVGSNLLRDMGGLRRAMPITFTSMTIGFAALMGLPPASGFFSKDSILVAMEHATSDDALTNAAAWLLYACALVTVAATGAYATRAWLRTFFGAAPARRPSPPSSGLPPSVGEHPSPDLVPSPDPVLSPDPVPSPGPDTVAAARASEPGHMHGQVPGRSDDAGPAGPHEETGAPEPSPPSAPARTPESSGPPRPLEPPSQEPPELIESSELADGSGPEGPVSMLWPVAVLAVPALLLGLVGVTAVEWGAAAVGVVLALLGGGVVLASWRADPAADPARVLGPFRAACERAFAIDALYAFLVVRPIGRLARGVVRTDGEVVDGAVRGSGHLAIGLSALVRLAQRGNAQTYVTGALAGILLVTVGAVMLR